MKIAKRQLRRIIKEEKAKILAEQYDDYDDYEDEDMQSDLLFDNDFLLEELQYLLDERGIEAMTLPEFSSLENEMTGAIERLRREMVR